MDNIEFPSVLAQIQTFDGGDPVGLRYRVYQLGRFQVFCEEEQSADNETNHTTEDVGFLVMENQDIQKKHAKLFLPADSLTRKDTTEKEEQGFAGDIHIFPNPNNGTFQVAISSDFWINGKMRVSTIEGAIIGEFPIRSNHYEYTIPDASPGKYVVQCIKNQTVVSEIIIVR